ncbi:MAG TPA: Hpt domain-containing protein, partial [Rubrivivax sp.]|nr:Hpt domain-containing protein [Rubrivivax sp.]
APGPGFTSPPGEDGGADGPEPALPELPGFDLQPLLARVRNNRRLVWKLLESYVETEGVTAAELDELLRAKHFEQVRLRTHSLMGSAAALGATQVALSSKALNHALRSNPGEETPQLRMLADRLTEALRASISAAQAALARHQD